MKAATLASWEAKLRPFVAKLSPEKAVAIYSAGRLKFLKDLAAERPPAAYIPDESLIRTLWGIRFRGPVMNAAGMFKNGECYDMVALEGAAAYLGGTGTWNPREGNKHKETGIRLPFVPYARSGAASNYLGLPNDGDPVNADRAEKMGRINGCPVGWSVMGSPDYTGVNKLDMLVDSLHRYAKAGVNFLEINESCPNTEHGRPQHSDLATRLEYLQQHFLDKRERKLPVVVKFSNDTPVEQVRSLMDLLFHLGYDGVNFGNTSINYAGRRNAIDPKEQGLYDFFTTDKSKFGVGGGVSGRPLRESSLLLCATAVQHLRAGGPKQEFHVIRTGGIETAKDLIQSDAEGISMNQWFTGRWGAFAQHGYDSYRVLHEEYLAMKRGA